ncbi:ParA family protein [Celeribacter sp. PS-C1]|uniref:ParA family protein n=1 Tax=Celeribacter sp. PS-C1 TaxID=2820813 RepID=UPI001C6818C7|nr:ParA family protein [Celeribacter sp. PS-C1]MBW6419333.1 ParA family protein [Celeribacter sp. PS-C1]
MPIISFCSPKGGAGKTTSAIVLATTLSQGATVEVIDADPAARACAWAQRGNVPENMTIRTSRGERHIQDEIAEAAARVDVVIVDLEGAATNLNSMVLAESDLVVVPAGDEQQDVDAAVDALAQIALLERSLRREIRSAVLFGRTKAAVKARNARDLNGLMRANVETFSVELHDRTAFSSLHSLGGSLYDMSPKEVGGLPRAIANAEAFAAEIIERLGGAGK